MRTIITLLICMASSQAMAFTIAWTPATGDVDGYIVEESADNGQTWTVNQQLQNPQPNANGFIEASVAEPAQLTVYRVKAFNQEGQSLLRHMIVGHDPASAGALPVWGAETKIGSTP